MAEINLHTVTRSTTRKMSKNPTCYCKSPGKGQQTQLHAEPPKKQSMSTWLKIPEKSLAPTQTNIKDATKQTKTQANPKPPVPHSTYRRLPICLVAMQGSYDSDKIKKTWKTKIFVKKTQEKPRKSENFCNIFWYSGKTQGIYCNRPPHTDLFILMFKKH